ncbi:hypothetical protein [Guptibacillus sedimenti]|uniref:hypothetical protein n=1 Tax=Guptibacillus sedimenti TaxID=3025680 RepID=UPI002360B0FB|nr:hypothetical protein [Pseudalkalibacillus sedimenti]
MLNKSWVNNLIGCLLLLSSARSLDLLIHKEYGLLGFNFISFIGCLLASCYYFYEGYCLYKKNRSETM